MYSILQDCSISLESMIFLFYITKAAESMHEQLLSPSSLHSQLNFLVAHFQPQRQALARLHPLESADALPTVSTVTQGDQLESQTVHPRRRGRNSNEYLTLKQGQYRD